MYGSVTEFHKLTLVYPSGCATCL